MADTQNQMHIKQFKDNIILAVQQENSLLDYTVRRENLNSEAFFFNKLGAITLEEKLSRFSPTPFADPKHSRRKLTPYTFHKSLFIDSFDAERSNIVGLQSDYMKSLIMAAKVKKDQLIIAAATGNAFEGKEGETPVAFSNAQTVFQDGTFGTNGGGTAVGLTSDKILTAAKILKKNKVSTMEKMYCIISAQQEEELMKDAKFINRDFTAGQVLDKGVIGAWNGINFIRSEELTGSTTQVRDVLLYTETALGLGINTELTTEIGKDPAHSFATVLYVSMTMGATRIEDEKIVRIQCKDTSFTL